VTPFTQNSARERYMTLKGGFTLCPRQRSFFLKEFGEHLIVKFTLGHFTEAYWRKF